MSKINKSSKLQENSFEVLRGGKLPEGMRRRLLAELKRKVAAKLKEESAIRQQASKYFSQIQKPTGTVVGDQAEAMRGLLGITDQLAKRKLVMPATVKVPQGIIAASYTLRFTPPYAGLGVDSAYTDGNGNPAVSALEDPNAGQLSSSVATNFDNASGGSAFSAIGIQFRPIIGPATARVWFDYGVAFSWSVNSLGPQAYSAAGCVFQINPSDFSADTRVAFLEWREDAFNTLKFDARSIAGQSPILQLPVSPDHSYIVIISLYCEASGFGWPGSLAVANASVTVPSITVEVTSNPVTEI